MPGKDRSGRAAKAILLIALAFLALALVRPGPMGLKLAVNQTGFTFRLSASFVKIAFDIGQSCSKSDRCPGLPA